MHNTVLLHVACLAIIGQGGGQSTYRPATDSMNAETRSEIIADHVAPAMMAFVEAVLDSPWKEEFGVVSVKELEDNPAVYDRIRSLELELRHELQRILADNPDLVFVAPVYGRFILFVERRADQGDRTRGDLFVPADHGLTFGAEADPDQRRADVRRHDGLVSIRLPALNDSRYVADLLLQFRDKEPQRGSVGPGQ